MIGGFLLAVPNLRISIDLLLLCHVVVDSSLQRREGSNYNTGDSAFGSEGTFEDMKLDRAASTGVEAIDKTLMQHLIYCDHLLQELSQVNTFLSQCLHDTS